MAKLVEILARELEEWPEQYALIIQDDCGSLHGYLSLSKDDMDQEGLPYDPVEIAWDGASVEVTRAEWQAAVDALKKAGVIGWWHPLANNEHNKAFPAVTSTWVQCRDLGDGYEGRKEDGSEYHVLTKYWRWEPVSKKNVEWDGVGLPPVGMVCEWAGCTYAPEDPKEPDLHVGDRVKIIAHFKDVDFDLAAFTFNPQVHNPSRGSAWVNQGASGCFRPIRTPEQIAAEERELGITEIARAMMIGLVVAGSGDFERATKLYDAGYRKQEPK